MAFPKTDMMFIKNSAVCSKQAKLNSKSPSFQCKLVINIGNNKTIIAHAFKQISQNLIGHKIMRNIYLDEFYNIMHTMIAMILVWNSFVIKNGCRIGMNVILSTEKQTYI